MPPSITYARRVDIEADIRTYAVARADEERRKSYMDLTRDPEVRFVQEGDRVRFVFDFLLCYQAQSGSDWYEHHAWTGTARIDGDRLVDIDAKPAWMQHVTEHAMHYAEPTYSRSDQFAELAKTLG